MSAATDPALMSAEQLLDGFATQALSPVEALQAITERVARLNPSLNAFAVMNPQALVAAGESAARWRAGRPIGLLSTVGTVDQIVEDLHAYRDRWGISYYVVHEPYMDAFAPVLARLARN